MANKAINDLDNASSLDSTDLLVLWDSSTNTAQNMSGQQFAAWLVSLANGHGGISDFSIVDSGTSGDGQLHTATLTYAGDASTYTFSWRDGYKGDTGAQTYVYIRYANQNPSSDGDMTTTPDSWIGIYAGLESDADNLHYTDYAWYSWVGPQGEGVSYTAETGVVGNTKTYTMYTASGTVCGTFSVTGGSGSVNTVNGIGIDANNDVSVTVGSVTDLGLTAGSATIAGAYSALQSKQVLICPASDFTTTELPLSRGNRVTDGAVEIFKGDGTDGWIEFHGRLDSVGDYRMYFNSSDVPDGNWVDIGGNVDFASSMYFNYGDPLNVLAIKRNGVVYLTVQSTSRVWVADNSVCTIPSGFRPPTQIQFPASASQYNATVYIQSSNGDTKVGYIDPAASSNTRIIFTISYPV